MHSGILDVSMIVTGSTVHGPAKENEPAVRHAERDRCAAAGQNGNGSKVPRRFTAFDAGFIALCAALNVTVGYLAGMLRLPLYLDSIGTILTASLFGWWYGVMVGLAGLAVLAMTVTPTVAAYAGTAVVTALAVSVAVRLGFLSRPAPTVIWGIVIGIAAALASAPITTLLYGGVSLAGSDAITAAFRATGLPLWRSVLYGGLVTDILDKLLTAFVCYALVRSLPPRMLARFPRNPLR